MVKLINSIDVMILTARYLYSIKYTILLTIIGLVYSIFLLIAGTIYDCLTLVLFILMPIMLYMLGICLDAIANEYPYHFLQ